MILANFVFQKMLNETAEVAHLINLNCDQADTMVTEWGDTSVTFTTLVSLQAVVAPWRKEEEEESDSEEEETALVPDISLVTTELKSLDLFQGTMEAMLT
jgi:hypothetical protein